MSEATHEVDIYKDNTARILRFPSLTSALRDEVTQNFIRRFPKKNKEVSKLIPYNIVDELKIIHYRASLFDAL